jgi:hypothetical protein
MDIEALLVHSHAGFSAVVPLSLTSSLQKSRNCPLELQLQTSKIVLPSNFWSHSPKGSLLME